MIRNLKRLYSTARTSSKTKPLKQHNKAREQRDQFREQRDKAREQRDQFREQRDKAREQRDQFWEQRNEAREQRDQFWEQRNKAREQRDLFREQRNELKDTRFGLFSQTIMRGKDVQEALIIAGKEMYDKRAFSDLRSFSNGLIQGNEYKDIGVLLSAICRHALGHIESANIFFSHTPQGLISKYTPLIFFDNLMSVDREKGIEGLRDFFETKINQQDYRTAFEVVQILNKYGLTEQAITLMNHIPNDIEKNEDWDEEMKTSFEWCRKVINERKAHIPDYGDKIVIGLMDYKLLSRAQSSSNVGDYVQTLAALTNIARHQYIQFEAEDSELNSFVKNIQNRVLPEKKLKEGKNSKVQIVPVDRDFSSGRPYVNPVWMISNGWFMHANENGEFDFPYHSKIRPIFLSFHINRAEVLSEDIIKYLKKYEPIGCRDWTTVYLLHNIGVKAFFSGCLTTTIGGIYNYQRSQENNLVANVEASLTAQDAAGAEIHRFIQLYDEVRDYSLVEGLKKADETLSEYMPFNKVITSRLHCYLPTKSIGLDVDFRPRYGADVRFDGLHPLSDEAFAKIRFGLEEKLATVLQALFRGEKEEDIYKLWAEICQKDVHFAEEKIQNYPTLTYKEELHNKLAKKILFSRQCDFERPYSNTMHFAFCIDNNLAEPFEVAVNSLLSKNRQDVVIHVFERNLCIHTKERLKTSFPDTQFIWYDLTEVSYGEVHLLSHITLSTMDRLLIPEVLVDVERIIYLDVDLIIRGDISELFNMDLEGNAIGACKSTSKSWKTGWGLINLKATKQDVETARKMRLWSSGSGDILFQTFNAGMLLMDLSKLRSENFTTESLAMVEAFGFHDQDAINFFCRGRFKLLDQKWNCIANQNNPEKSIILHWAGTDKPWGEKACPLQNEYKEILQKIKK